MSYLHSDEELPNFSGIVRLFPLPNLVLFPGVMQPLHIFEPRYRKLVEDALQNDQLIAIVLYQPSWESCLFGEPPIHSVVCVGKIIAHSEMPDGRFNLLLKGIRRAEIVREISSDEPYRMAEVRLLSEAPQPDEYSGDILHSALMRRFFELSNQGEMATDCFGHLIEKDLPLGNLVDLIAFSLELDPEQQQSILEALDPRGRCERLLAAMDELESAQQMAVAVSSEFPPEFSYN